MATHTAADVGASRLWIPPLPGKRKINCDISGKPAITRVYVSLSVYMWHDILLSHLADFIMFIKLFDYKLLYNQSNEVIFNQIKYH